MTNEQSIRDHKAKLGILRAKQKNGNLMKFIDDLMAACDAQLKKLTPQALKTLDDLMNMSETLKKVINFYETERSKRIITTQELFDQFKDLSSDKNKELMKLTSKDIDPVAKSKIKEILDLLKTPGAGYKVSGLNMNETSAADLEQMRLLYMATKC